MLDFISNSEAIAESREAAEIAGLRCVSDGGPGIRRRKVGTGFSYVAANGGRLSNMEALRRIKSLVIPPAWTQVWISPVANGHIQATGRDAKGRKQYRYHPAFRAVRGLTTLENRHVAIEGAARRFQFTGKSGKQ